MEFSDDEIQNLYAWVDSVPLSRPKRNISRDFSDGVLMAELLNHFYPRIVELHNYSAANALSQKTYNWQTLNKRVLKRVGVVLTQTEMTDIANCVPMAVEKFLFKIYDKVNEDRNRLDNKSSSSSRKTQNQGLESTFFGSQPSRRSPHLDSARANLRSQSSDMEVPVSRMGTTMSGRADLQREVDTEILIEKEQTIQELRETVDILETKIKKLEQLVHLKDSKIQALTLKLQSFQS
ncbi:hypothetical protein GUITHDRAFT_117123 [Guillardia theta CCMP2712]|uniref:Calponin-homology (CH) domain-containing protein n=1 Tax=Guillardia theta (strain CCMP2712) TaxID=905079 RepID=L1IKN6_GUITC|nr:hypothetical protein GUITHDRAFT_117123 [Guillardia theta CCMP2712]EKX36697.1 hypothetical protein GUITHDRAFT_117123 [Guillardia theta CCMP2712]|eukprot:XP_005823677.1 hypothetical protein GUITHDRAFT_117123 [Guillardia theta CCMP2712]